MLVKESDLGDFLLNGESPTKTTRSEETESVLVLLSITTLNTGRNYTFV